MIQQKEKTGWRDCLCIFFTIVIILGIIGAHVAVIMEAVDSYNIEKNEILYNNISIPLKNIYIDKNYFNNSMIHKIKLGNNLENITIYKMFENNHKLCNKTEILLEYDKNTCNHEKCKFYKDIEQKINMYQLKNKEDCFKNIDDIDYSKPYNRMGRC